MAKKKLQQQVHIQNPNPKSEPELTSNSVWVLDSAQKGQTHIQESSKMPRVCWQQTISHKYVMIELLILEQTQAHDFDVI